MANIKKLLQLELAEKNSRFTANPSTIALCSFLFASLV